MANLRVDEIAAVGVSTENTSGPVLKGNFSCNSQNWLTLPKGTTTQRSRGRGVFGGGNSDSTNDTIQYVQIQSQGNALDFGDLIPASLRRKY